MSNRKRGNQLGNTCIPSFLWNYYLIKILWRYFYLLNNNFNMKKLILNLIAFTSDVQEQNCLPRGARSSSLSFSLCFFYLQTRCELLRGRAFEPEYLTKPLSLPKRRRFISISRLSSVSAMGQVLDKLQGDNHSLFIGFFFFYLVVLFDVGIFWRLVFDLYQEDEIIAYNLIHTNEKESETKTAIKITTKILQNF